MLYDDGHPSPRLCNSNHFTDGSSSHPVINKGYSDLQNDRITKP